MGSLMAGWSIAFYTRQHGLDVATASALVGFTGLVFGPVGHLAGGWINDRLRGRGMIGSQPYVMAGSLTAAMIAATAFALAPNVKVAALSYGLSYGLLCASGPTGFSGIQLPTPERQRGVISSIFLMTYNALGNGLGPFLVGVVGDSFFSGPEQLGSAMAASIVIVLAIGLPFAILCAPAFDRAVRAQEQEQAAR
jgi:MFS family permease